MSKPLNKEILADFCVELVNRKSEILLQALELLERLRTNTSDSLLRIPAELTELLNGEENFEKIVNTKNVEELAELLSQYSTDSMIKVYENNYLKAKFPILAQSQFLDI
ncbi:hypothetical protein OQH60_02010 [Campylobacter sp. MIT 21-1685]|uniref:hypothetical protein n=1 Tax=unclassified Campylobacter TaxID=2593542 RepID=UPI00224B78CA|nr:MULTISPECIES: hypothetical protein [unclassified Campylobacter]MCX2682654.1 hypothetical protein [Campylobacter sp. MIT 21-1684]MCX2750934.1 hypothetical protein [Campylobacter sp. MIT 21-1682]MCX2807133.1 hypothetical protein [Campylobacter sp. MIT 21-1685]